VVEEPLDVLALERTDGFQGRYHVLHGALSPIEGIGPEDLKIRPLIERLRTGEIREVILATIPAGRRRHRHVPAQAAPAVSGAHHPPGARLAVRRRPGIRRSAYPVTRAVGKTGDGSQIN